VKIPLVVKPIVHRKKEKFEVWYNGEKKIIDAPIKPYFYSYKPDLPIKAKLDKLEAIPLSNASMTDSFQKKTFYKYSFSTRSDLVSSRNKVGMKNAFESNIPFVVRHRLDYPDLWTKFPNKKKLNFIFLDIEQYTQPDQKFPTFEERIIAISWCGNDRDIKTIFLNKDTKSDGKMLRYFVDAWKKIDPDVIVVYNKNYDIPTIIHRCERNNIDTAHLSRSKEKPYVGGREGVTIPGRAIYDVYDSARVDQALNGEVADRGLKSVSNFYGYEEEREPLDMKQVHKYVGTKELIKYNIDDVKRLLKVFDVYWTNIEFNANDLKLPLNFVTDLNITNLGLVVVGDEYRKRDIIADGRNYERYPEIFQREKKSSEANYEGAIVDIYQKGYFEPVYKADFSSMYPNIMSSFNLSPDTTTLVEYRAYQPNFKMIEEDQWYIYHIPDRILERTLVIQVLKDRGFCSDLVGRFLDERSGYKKKWKQTKIKKWKALSDNRKVKANGGVYGIQGSSVHPFGFAPIGIATTGIGRVSMQLLMDVLKSIHPKSLIETDTDGVYYSAKNHDKDALIELFNEKVYEKFQKDDLTLTIDVDEFNKGWFYKAKNYVLEPKGGGKLIYHGAAMKSSSKSMINKNLIHELAYAKLNKKPTKKIVKEYLKLDFPLKDFAMSRKLGMHMHQYKQPDSTLVIQLARDAKRHFGIKPEIDTQYWYVKTKYGYRLLELSRREEIDEEYYKNDIMNVAEMFDSHIISPTLDKWI